MIETIDEIESIESIETMEAIKAIEMIEKIKRNDMFNNEFILPNTLYSFYIDEVLKIAWEAGKAIMKIYEKDFEVAFKDDKSPLTIADKTAHEIIQKGLNQLSIKSIDSLPLLSEEGKEIPYEERKKWEYFWMIDPLDGTKEFIKKNGEFTVNIALIHKNKPIFGVVYAPAIETIYFTDNENAYKGRLETINFGLKNLEILNPPSNIQNPKSLKIVASKSHLNDETKKFIDSIKTIYSIDSIETISIGSSLKLCLVAEGKADIYPRLAPTMEWDTAAADAVIRKAGKMTYKYNETILNSIIAIDSISSIDSIKSIDSIDSIAYNKENLLNPWFVVF